ncbi:MAG: prephenate dehydrogenase/arogenate dehydrogenase family protein, partial [Candidatus Omnitrophica bacterium]|nr:prephenate dehydrogenase/arogenate dehydrogenase family protein [Candidatus Omnitrophota bacterium]
VGSEVSVAEKVCKIAKGDAIMFDVGSTKGMIVKEIDKIVPPSLNFVGTHPMAGSEKSGVESARANLFEESLCLITKSKKTDARALKKVKKFWESLGAACIVMTPDNHDRHIASVSHLPHLVAFTLLRAVDPESLPYAANGFKDATRIGASDPRMWHDIFMSNKAAILKALTGYKKNLALLERMITKGYSKRLVGILSASKAIRDKFGDKK